MSSMVRALKTATLLVAIFVSCVFLLGGVVFVWLGAMALAPENWQMPITALVLAVVVAGVLGLIESHK